MKYLNITLLCLILIGCSTGNIQRTSKTIKFTQESTILAASTVDEMCSQGILNQEQCDIASNLYDRAKDTYTELLEVQLAIIEARQMNEDTTEYENQYKILLRKFTLISQKLVELAARGDE